MTAAPDMLDNRDFEGGEESEAAPWGAFARRARALVHLLSLWCR